MLATHQSLRQYALSILRQTDPQQKARQARQASNAWKSGQLPILVSQEPCQINSPPGRPDKPVFVSPRDMPRRRAGSKKGLQALLHALVHIELNAIDLSFDLIARFAHLPMPHAFFEEAVQVGLEEANHYVMLNDLLEKCGTSYGYFPAHDGFWDAALETEHDILARLAIVQLVLEARGLDITPAMIDKLKKSGETQIVKGLEIIYRDEIKHVAFGVKWFKFLCGQKNLNPESHFQSLVKKHFHRSLKAPFNEKARSKAGLTSDFYRALATP